MKANRLQRQGRTEELNAYTSRHVGRWARSLLRAAGANVTVQTGAPIVPIHIQGSYNGKQRSQHYLIKGYDCEC